MDATLQVLYTIPSTHHTYTLYTILMDATLQSATLGREWLLQMGEGAQKSGLKIQYCMAYSRFALQSVEVPVVNQIRVTDDYAVDLTDKHGKPVNLRTGVSSMLAAAVGLAPSKDVWWSTRAQPGAPKYKKFDLHAPSPAAHAAIATLTAGPVAPGDAVDKQNASLILRSCRSDGVLLKPSYPATAVDAYFARKAFGTGGPHGELYSTYSALPECAGCGRWGTVLAMDMLDDYSLGYTDLRQKLQTTTDTEAQPPSIAYQSWPPVAPLSTQTLTQQQQQQQQQQQSTATATTVAWLPFSSSTDTIPINKCGIDDFQVGCVRYSYCTLLYSYCTHTVRYCTYTVLILYSYCTPTVPIPYSYQVWHTAPVMCDGAWALMGEVSVGSDPVSVAKWVPVAPKRFEAASCSAQGELGVTVKGAPGEIVGVAFADLKTGEVVTASCTLPAAADKAGEAIARSDGTCK
jgi:hypothetical protein